MKTFKDREKREWSIDLCTKDLERVRDLVGVDLMEIQPAP